jgi:hypothetical protein
MSPYNRWLRVAMIVAVLSAGGCAFGKKPFADDPLLTRRAVWAERPKARRTEPPAEVNPAPPPAPPGPLIGNPDTGPRPLELVTSP